MAITKPEALKHLEKSRQVLAVYNQLRAEGRHIQWAVVVLFYCSLHLVQSYFIESASTQRDVPTNHGNRETMIAIKIPPLIGAYSFLQTRSEWVRYEVNRPNFSVSDLDSFYDNQFTHIMNIISSRGIELIPTSNAVSAPPTTPAPRH